MGTKPLVIERIAVTRLSNKPENVRYGLKFRIDGEDDVIKLFSRAVLDAKRLKGMDLLKKIIGFDDNYFRKNNVLLQICRDVIHQNRCVIIDGETICDSETFRKLWNGSIANYYESKKRKENV